MGDRYPQVQKGYPEHSPDNFNGGPPPRDRRRSRAQGQDLSGNQDGQLCTYDMGEQADEAETLVAYIKAYDFAEGAVNGIDISAATDPFSGVDADIVPSPLLQNIEVIAEVQWGHDGVTKKALMNLPAGVIVKMQAGASYMRAHAKLTARYFERFQETNPTTNYFYLNDDPNLRNNIFNAIGSPLLAARAGFDPTGDDRMPQTPIHVDGVISRGSVSLPSGGSSDRSSRPCRRFYGAVPDAGSSTVNQVFCPIAFGAAAVMLQANPALYTDANGVAFAPLFFAMLDHAGNVVGQQSANQFVPLIANCQQIIVYNSGANGKENPFALVYDLGL